MLKVPPNNQHKSNDVQVNQRTEFQDTKLLPEQSAKLNTHISYLASSSTLATRTR